MLLTLLLALLLAGSAGAGPRAADPWFQQGQKAVSRVRERLPAGPPARNVVLFVGDGMGISTVTAARILEGQQQGGSGEEHVLSFETLPHVALLKTYNTDEMVPDSAGTMSAMMTGVKTKAGVISLDDHVVPGDASSAAAARVPTLFEEAETHGLATGVVTTARITHATPAATYAHSPSRRWEVDSKLSRDALKSDFPDIARQLVAFRFGDGIDVMLGGGRSYLLPASLSDPEYPDVRGRRQDERNLVVEWEHARSGRAYVWNAAQLAALDLGPGGTVRQVLGLFEPEHMKYESERAKDPGGEPSLAEMTGKALDLLSRNPKGFVLVIEGGRIDHAHHANNAFRALSETLAMARAVKVVMERTSRKDTLVVVTADHSHPLTISGYARRGNPILGLVEENDPSGGPAQLARDGQGHPYSLLHYTIGPGYVGASDTQPEGIKHFPHHAEHFTLPKKRHDPSEGDPEAPDTLQAALLPRASGVHSGEDVPVYAGGPWSGLFDGVQEQNYVYHALVTALGWNTPLQPRNDTHREREPR